MIDNSNMVADIIAAKAVVHDMVELGMAVPDDLLDRARCVGEHTYAYEIVARRAEESRLADWCAANPELVAWLRAGGVIPAVRLSSAKARGAAKGYAYWGAAHYSVYWSEWLGRPCSRCDRRAHSDRRSLRLAQRDVDGAVEECGGIQIINLGPPSDEDLATMVDWFQEHQPR